MTWTQEMIHEAYKKLEMLALTDSSFRSKLLLNANEAIESILGKKLPDNYNVNVIEADPYYSATFVVPPMISNEIRDEALLAVAGGMSDDMSEDCKLEVSCSGSALIVVG